MVARQILDLLVKVRILVGQHKKKYVIDIQSITYFVFFTVAQHLLTFSFFVSRRRRYVSEIYNYSTNDPAEYKAS